MGLFKNSSHDKIVSYLRSNGFEIKEAKKHSKAFNDDGVVITIPRHTKISIGVTNQIARQLIDVCGLDEQEVLRAIKK